MIRYPGIYRATVVNVEDPEYRGRIKVNVPQVLGTEFSGWALPCFPFGGSKDVGFFAVPPVSSVVWIMFEGGDPNLPVWLGSWVPSPARDETWAPKEGVVDENGGSGRWPNNDTSGSAEEDNATIDGDAEPDKQRPTNYVHRTPGGHTLEMDDTGGQEKIILRDRLGQFIMLRSKDGEEKILIKDKAGNYIFFDPVGGKLNVQVSGDVHINCTGQVYLQDDAGDVEKVARVGDMVNVTFGSSAGMHPIAEGSSKVQAGG